MYQLPIVGTLYQDLVDGKTVEHEFTNGLKIRVYFIREQMGICVEAFGLDEDIPNTLTRVVPNVRR